MNKTLFAISILALLILSACAKEEVYACTMDAKICPDGSAVGRTGPDCEFEACPSTSSTCNHDDINKAYVGKSVEECATMRFTCIEGKEYFADECGCGCRPLVVNEQNPIDEDKRYMGLSAEECSTALFTCNEGEKAFFDDLGCGCVSSQPTGKIKVTDCTPEQKSAQACTKEYLPVCGWSDPAKIQCIKYPCAQTFGNICSACADENVISWSMGECPSG